MPRKSAGRTVLFPFDYDGVRLLPSRFLDQVKRTQAVYGAVPNDDILKGFRRNAGQPSPGNDLRGWCAKTTSVIFGQLLSGMVRISRATGEPFHRDKALALFDGWRKTVGADGNVRMRPYDWEKLVCAMVDLHTYAGVESALDVLAETTKWAARTFDRSRRPADGHDFQGVGPGGTSEWYTLPENLYRAYLASGNPLFRDFADVWRYEHFWGQFAETSMPRVVLPVHAYSHLNTFSSAAMAYAVTGEQRYLQLCVNAHDFFVQTQCYATGGFGPDERLMPPDGSLGRSLELYAGHAEVPCGTWAATKLCRYLISFTGQARFGDWIETMLYNAIGASLPTEPDGRTFYYGDYRVSSGIKQYYWHEWPCCSGTYLQTVADFHNTIYFSDETGLSVNLFLPSEVRWLHDGQPVAFRQETDYPDSETTTLAFESARPVALTLRFRVPGWSRDVSAELNGSSLAFRAAPGGWAAIDREFQPGDRVRIHLPMSMRMVPVDCQHPDRVAVMYGPVVLAQDEACCRRPLALSGGAELSRQLVYDGPGIRFRLLNGVPERHTRYLQPLHTIPPFRPYWVYFDLHELPLY
jgi:DUF1680 family protein